MPTVYRVTAVWSGFQGAPGYSKFSFIDLATDTQRNAAGAGVRAYFQSQQVYLLTGWTVTVLPTVQEFDVTFGTLTGEQSMSAPPAATSGVATSAPWAAGAGYFVSWRTSGYFLGRRVQGRTFHVPAIGCFDVDGTLSSAALSTINAAAQALVDLSGADLAVWARQYDHPVPPTRPHQIGGAVFPVTARLVKDQASSLRSRRT